MFRKLRRRIALVIYPEMEAKKKVWYPWDANPLRLGRMGVPVNILDQLPPETVNALLAAAEQSVAEGSGIQGFRARVRQVLDRDPRFIPSGAPKSRESSPSPELPACGRAIRKAQEPIPGAEARPSHAPRSAQSAETAWLPEVPERPFVARPIGQSTPRFRFLRPNPEGASE